MDGVTVVAVCEKGHHTVRRETRETEEECTSIRTMSFPPKSLNTFHQVPPLKGPHLSVSPHWQPGSQHVDLGQGHTNHTESSPWHPFLFITFFREWRKEIKDAAQSINFCSDFVNKQHTVHCPDPSSQGLPNSLEIWQAAVSLDCNQSFFL